MTDNTSNDSDGLRVHNSAFADEPGLPAGASFEMPSYDIDPADQGIVDEILAEDPVTDAPSPVTLKGRVMLPAKVTLAMLPAELQADVAAKLKGVHPDKFEALEQEYIAEALRANSLNVRTVMGLGDGAGLYAKEQVAIANEARQLLAEFDKNTADLAEVSHYEARANDEGRTEPHPVLAMSAERRAATLRRQEEISYRVKLLQTVEGQRRLAKALKEDVERRKAARELVEDNAEIARRVDTEAREARIAAQVAAKVRMKG